MLSTRLQREQIGAIGAAMRKLFDALRALVYMSGFVLLWGWIALSVRMDDSKLGVALPAWMGSLAIPFMLLGGTLALFCAETFVVRGTGTPAPFDAPRQFVATGPYRYVRNPMYIGGWFALLGFGLYLHSLSILLMSLAWLLLAHLFVVLYEEPHLEGKFGPTYRNYRRSVPRWVPRVPHSDGNGAS
jgi:protein-S-isoprenylcysteine O-methyltransferase Ste14